MTHEVRVDNTSAKPSEEFLQGSGTVVTETEEPIVEVITIQGSGEEAKAALVETIQEVWKR